MPTSAHQKGENKMLKNKLGIKTPFELAQMEEKITKQKAFELFETGKLETFEVGTFKGLARNPSVFV